MDKINYRTEFDRGDEQFFTNPGTKYIDQYVESIDKDGKKFLKLKGKSNVYEKIQASLEETKTYNILERYAQSGDIGLLERRESIFGDFTDVPKTPLELQNLLMKADAQFESLDKDVREAFENDSGMFKQSILDGSFADKIVNFRKNKKGISQDVKSEEPVQQTTQNEGVNLNES